MVTLDALVFLSLGVFMGLVMCILWWKEPHGKDDGGRRGG